MSELRNREAGLITGQKIMIHELQAQLSTAESTIAELREALEEIQGIAACYIPDSQPDMGKIEQVCISALFDQPDRGDE